MIHVRRAKAWLAFSALFFTGCGSDDGGGAGGGPSGGVLLRATPGATDASCPHGGTKLEFGTDANQNGVLDADEVTGSQLVCDRAAPTLTTVTPTGSSAKCPNGGTLVKSGPDTNGNGVLDDAEVATTNEICGGGGSVELAKTTSIAPGDVSCPFGGVSTERGLDNGANGGIAGDGVLQPEEVQSTTIACNGSGSNPNSFVPPPGPVGIGQILASGGAGTTGDGGSGCPVTLTTSTPTGGNLKIFKTGKVDASFAAPTEVPVFGARKLDVTANQTIPSYGTSGAASDGEYYTLGGSGLYFKESAANPQVSVTGIHVAPGVTLTFPTAMNFTLPNDFHNEGTVTTALSGGDRPPIDIQVAKFIGGPGSSVSLTGMPVAGGAGGTGGAFIVTAHRIVNAGTIDTSGAAGDAGGSFAGGGAGTIQLRATGSIVAGPVVSTGALKAVGGRGTGTGAGGPGGFIELSSTAHGVFVSGEIQRSGGIGGSTGGASGALTVKASNGGSVRASGTIVGKGGDVDEVGCGAGSCPGGFGGAVEILSEGGDIVLDANLVSPGGKGKGAAGGAGGRIDVRAQDGFDLLGGVSRPAGSIWYSGIIDVRGGQGASGASCNGVLFSMSTSYASGQEIELRGIASIDTSGGSGATGGWAGNVTLFNPTPSAGGVANHATITAKGGAASGGTGGRGGVVTLQAGDLASGPAMQTQAVVSAGAIDVSGGDGLGAGGISGTTAFLGRERLDIFAPITSLGGNGTGVGADGGLAQGAGLSSGGAFTSNAPLLYKGGDGTGKGGDCSPGITIHAGTVKASSPITCAGGNGTGGAGGIGGVLDIASSQSPSQLAALDNAGGTGMPPGVRGNIFIDGNPQP